MSKNHVQVLLYTSYLHIIGGIETFVMSWIDLMSPYYDIGILCPSFPPEIALKIIKKVPLFQSPEGLSCETLVMIRMMDIKPDVKYERSVRMCHACKARSEWFIRQDCDSIVHVSNASKKSFESDGAVIYNPLRRSTKKALLIVSATRIPGADKGRNADRMLRLANMLKDNHIPFLWLNFSDAPLSNAPQGFINVGVYEDLQPYIKKADYLVQLSDHEGFGYSVLEALVNGTAVICTPFETTEELGVIDGENGYIVPFDMDFDVNKLLKVPEFSYWYSNEGIRADWMELLGESKKTEYTPPAKVKVRILREYDDILLERHMRPGEIVEMDLERGYALAADKRKLVKLEGAYDYK